MADLKLKSVASKSNVLALKAPAMTLPEKHITNVLSGYEYDIAPVVPQLKQFLIYKMFQMAESQDPYTSLRGIELLAKTEWVGLFKERVEVSVSTKSTRELQAELEAIAIKVGYNTAKATMVSDSDDDDRLIL
jgi:hypothetical protein